VGNVTGLVVIAAMGCVGVAACASSTPPQRPAPAASSSTQPPAVTASPTPRATAAPTTTASSSAPCIGLSICPTPPPDAEGNPACYYQDGWEADSSGINVWYFREPTNMSNPEQVTADVRMNDGATASQIASIDAGQPVHQFQFPGIDKAAVQEVLLTRSTGRCFVIGPGGGQR
jgi:hypothetical protein